MFPRFYTYPKKYNPTYLGISLLPKPNYVLRNIKQEPIDCEHEIVDIGIYDLLRPPFRHSKNKIDAWKNLETSGWKVVPDCPDLTGEFEGTIFDNLLKEQEKAIKKYNLGIHIYRFTNYWWGYVHKMDNTEYSWELLTELYDPSDLSQMPVIQSRYGNLTSLMNFCDKFIDYFGKPEKLAVGSVCKMDNHSTSAMMLKEVRRKFTKSWIHAFGLRFKALRKAWEYINSYDSTAWTFPRIAGNPSCKNFIQCVQYYYDYLLALKVFKYSLTCFDVVQTRLGVKV